MRDIVRAAIGIIIAFVVHSLLGQISHVLPIFFNLFSLAVIYFAMEKGEVFGAVMGMCCGFIQDSFSLGVFGIAGISKTIMGFAAGYFSSRMDVNPFRRSLVFIFSLVGGELIIWSLIYIFVYSEAVYTARGAIVFQPLLTALTGSLLFYALRKLRESRRRMG